MNADLERLTQRVNQANQHLKTAHETRERESENLNEHWHQIRDRFAEQETGLARLRAQVVELEDSRDVLFGLVNTLLGAIEGSIDHMLDETVPNLATKAGDLLTAEPEPATPEPVDAEAASVASPAMPEEPAAQQTDAVDEPVGETLSPGIRSLINRLQGTFHAATEDAPEDEGPENEGGGDETEDAKDDDLARDLQEIEQLKIELQGLRSRITTQVA